MADLKLSETAAIAAKHKQKSELKVQGDCHSRDKIYSIIALDYDDQRKKETTANIQTYFCLFIHDEREAYHSQRGKHIGNRVSLHVSVSQQFIKHDFVKVEVCLWSSLFA